MVDSGRQPDDARGGADARPLAELSRELEQITQERDHLLAHSRNLEFELRRVAVASARVRELERLLADAEARLRRASPVHMARWLVLNPRAAAGRIYRQLCDRVLWRAREAYRVYRLGERRSRT